MKRLIIFAGIIALIGLTGSAKAQYDVNALKYSNLSFGGPARSMSTGGAFGAPGADFSVLSTNPAGIGLYKNSVIMLSPSFYSMNTESSFYEEKDEDLKYQFNFTNAGFILNLSNPGSKWKNIQFGFGVNKLQDFHQRTSIKGFNAESSLMTEYVDKANTMGELSYYDTELAWNANLIYKKNQNSDFPVTTDAPYGGIEQRKKIKEEGAINEMVFSLGGNYSEKLYMGMTVGIPILNHTLNSTYTETDTKDTINMLKNYDLHEEITTSGSGLNFKFGLIYRPADWLRIGGAVHTPTFYSLHEDYSRTITSNFENNYNDFDTTVTAPGEFDYELRTPMRAIGDIAFIIGKSGMITAEYEYVDYSTAYLSEEDDISTNSTRNFEEDNNNVENKYSSAHNIKVGAELNLKPFQIRGGYSIFSSPYANNINDGARTFYTFGVGLKEKKYYVDLAYVMEQYEEDYYLYGTEFSGAELEASKNKYNGNRLVLTVGLRL